MSTLESRIDDLYRTPLEQFVAARSALASELKGADARRVKALKKPTIVPWVVNQVYWHARLEFDRVQQSGADLRRAQIAALEGRTADVQGAADAHRKAIASAVDRAVALAETAQQKPNRDGVARTFEALSLASAPQEQPGRLTHPLQPGGFELLAGVEPVLRTPMKGAPYANRIPDEQGAGDGLPPSHKASAHPHGLAGGETVPLSRVTKIPGSRSIPAAKTETRRAAEERAAAAERAAAERKRERARAAAARGHDAAIAKLEGELERARRQAAQARLAWDRATDEVSAAEQRLSEARGPRRM